MAVIFIATLNSYSLEKKSFAEIDTDELVTEIQTSAPCDDDHMNLALWLPTEFWQATFAADRSISSSETQEIINILKPFSLLAICQADISNFGSFRFYSKDDVKERLKIYYTDASQKRTAITPVSNVDADIKMLLDMLKPILASFAGNMGQNFHFFVLDDYASSERIINPYQPGKLELLLSQKTGVQMQCGIEFPLNALYVPRPCPNGKKAHVSWIYCPWTGQKLKE